jgi:hypothetical protein
MSLVEIACTVANASERTYLIIYLFRQKTCLFMTYYCISFWRFCYCCLFGLLSVNCWLLMLLLFGYFQKGSGDFSENGEKVVDSCI